MAENAEINDFRKNENFPVASILLPKKARATILAFYDFARSTDEVADSIVMQQDEKLEILENVYSAISENIDNKNYSYIKPLLYHINKGELSKKHCLALLEAFIQDAKNPTYHNFLELLNYCQRSAATVGRVVLEASGEFSADIIASDKICSVLQILNHVQDLKFDYINLRRIYFSPTYFSGFVSLVKDNEDEDIKFFKNEILDKIDVMLEESRHLPQTINSFRVRAEVATIINICFALSKKLRENDIMEKRVTLSKFEKILCFKKALFSQILSENNTKTNDQIKLLPKKSRSSFFYPMLKLDKQQQKDIFTIYSFCRKIDNITDDSSSISSARHSLEKLQNDIEVVFSENHTDYPRDPLLRQISLLTQKYDFDKEYFLSQINGQFSDINNLMVRPDQNIFEQYCYDVACTVGLICIEIFGYNKKNKANIQQFAINLGHALQIINIMRDVEEDAAKGRIYIPAELLENTPLKAINADELHKNFPQYRELLASILANMALLATERFNAAYQNLPEEEQRNMEVALLMGKVYESYLNKMAEKKFVFSKSDIKLSKMEILKLLKN